MTSLQASFPSNFHVVKTDVQQLGQRQRSAVPSEQKIQHRVLVILSDAGLCASATELLSQEDFAVCAVHDGTQGLAECLNDGYGLILLDADISVLGGVGLLQELRSRSLVPVLFIAEREEQCVSGLEAGADDFILRPFGMAELIARVRGVLRRTNKLTAISAPVLQCDELSVNTQTHQAFFREQAIALTNVEFAILKCLIRCAGRIVSRDELAAVLYQRKSTPFERFIDVHISHLRRKIEEAKRVSIRTIRGTGYLLASCA